MCFRDITKIVSINGLYGLGSEYCCWYSLPTSLTTSHLYLKKKKKVNYFLKKSFTVGISSVELEREGTDTGEPLRTTWVCSGTPLGRELTFPLICSPFFCTTHSTHAHAQTQTHIYADCGRKIPCAYFFPLSTQAAEKRLAVTMATDGKEAKHDARVEVTVSDGPGKQNRWEKLLRGRFLKRQRSIHNYVTAWCLVHL